jgi:Cu+-exporting ATPase
LALLLVAKDKVSPSPTLRDIEKAESSIEHLPTWPGMAVQQIDAELLEAGDLVRVPHGSTPPADGTVLSIRPDLPDAILASFDESSLTGESKPVAKRAGDEVFLGTINKGEAVDIRIKSVGGDSM